MSFSSQDYGRGALATGNEEDRSISLIDQFSTFDGTFTAERDLRIDGVVNGSIVCRGTLFVAEGATVNAQIEAENITVAGDLTGDIDCRGRLRLLPSGVLRGKVKTRALVVAHGATYDGDLTMVTASAPVQSPEESEPPAELQPAPRPATRAARAETRARADAAPAAAPVDPGTPSTFIRRLGGQETAWENQAGDDQSPQAAAEE